MFPPHLPPPSASLAQHQTWLRLKIILAALAAGLFSGFIGAAIMLGWIWPAGLVFINQGGVLPSLNRLGLNQLTPEVIAAINQERLTIYRQLEGDGAVHWLNPADEIGQAVLLTSDGWAVLYAKDFKASAARGWQFLGSSGQLFMLAQSVIDSRAGLSYVKIIRVSGATTTPFDLLAGRPITFAPPRPGPSQVYVLVKGVWQSAVLRSERSGLGKVPHLDNEPAVGYVLDSNFPAGAPVVDGAGRLVGFVREGNVVLPGVTIDHLFPQVLSRGKVAYPSLGVEGWFDDEQPIIINGKRQSGFAVSKIVGRNNLLRRGDIITMLNGEAVRPEMWWDKLQNAPSVNVSVLRAGKVIEFTVPVVEL